MNSFKSFVFKHWRALLDILILLLIFSYIASALESSLLIKMTTTTGGDMASHFPTAVYLKNMLFEQGRMISWQPGNYAGFPLFQFYFPFPFLIMVILNLVIPLKIAFKLISVLGIFMLPLCSYLALRLMKIKYPAPIFAALFSLPFLFAEGNSMWGGNILSNLAGEFCFQIGFALSILFIASIYGHIKSNRYVIFNGLLLGVIGLTHGVGLLFAGLTSLFFLMQPKSFIKNIQYLFRVYGLAIGFMAFWFFPFLSGVKWSTKFNLLWTINSFTEVFPKILWPYLGVAAFGSFVVLLFFIFQCRERRKNYYGIYQSILYLWFSILLAALLYKTAFELNVVDIRFLPYIEYLPMLLAAIVIGSLSVRFKGISLLVIIVAVTNFMWINQHSKSVSSWSRYNYSGFEGMNGWSTFKAVNDYLKGDETDPRVVYEHSSKYNQFGTIRAFENLPYFSGRSTMEGLYIQSSITAPFAFYLQSEISSPGSCPLRQYDYSPLNLKKAVHHFRIFNISHFITISEQIKREARKNPDLESVATFEKIEIFKVTPQQYSYVEPLRFYPIITPINNWRDKAYQWFKQASENQSFLLFTEPGQKNIDELKKFPRSNNQQKFSQYQITGDIPQVSSKMYKNRIEIENARPGWPLLIKVSYHPNWKCIGAKGPYLTSPSLMTIIPTKKKVSMVFKRSFAEWLGLGITILTILISLIKIRFTRQLFYQELKIPGANLSIRSKKILLIILWATIIIIFGGFVFYQQSQNPARIKHKAENAYTRGDLDQALPLFAKVKKLSGTSGYGENASYFEALTLWRQKKYTKALESFQYLISKYPHSIHKPDALFHIGLCLQMIGNTESAREAWLKLKKNFPASRWSRYATEKLNENRPDYYRIAIEYFDKGKLHAAAKLFSQIKEKSNNLMTRRNAAYFNAICFFKLKEWENCLKKLKNIIELDKKSPWAAEVYYHIGLCQKNLGRVNKAKQVYQEIIKLYPKSRWAVFAEQRLKELQK